MQTNPEPVHPRAPATPVHVGPSPESVPAGTPWPLEALIAVREERDRALLLRELAAEPGFKARGPVGNAVDLLREARSRPCDVVILDVRLPDLDAFEALELIPKEHRPLAVVVLSDRPRDAVRAFDARAVDFVDSPLDPARLHVAWRRASRRARGLRLRGSGRPVDAEGSPARSADGPVRRLVLRDGRRWSVVPVDELVRIDGDKNYVRLTTRSGSSRRLRGTMQTLECRLDTRKFFRTHRSTIVRLDQVVEFERTKHGDFRAVLSDGSRVTAARARGGAFLAALEGSEEGGEPV